MDVGLVENIIIFIISIVVLLFSTNQLISYALNTSLKYKISPTVIGITLLAVGTSLPELVVSAIAISFSDYSLAHANIIGSNITNILLIAGISVLAGKVRLGSKKTQKSLYLLLISSIFYFLGFKYELNSLIFSGLLLSSAIIFTILEYKWAGEDKFAVDKKILKGKYKQVGIITAIFSLIGITISGISLIYSVESISSLTGISTTILGQTITALSTSLPELITSIIAVRRNSDKLLLGNLIGSNIYNILFIGGIIIFFGGTVRLTNIIDFMLIVTALFVFTGIKYSKQILPKRIAYLCLFGFIYYIYSSFYIN